MQRILYTRHDGGVNIFTPTDYILTWLSEGGMWNDRPRGFADEQIERFTADGHDQRGVERYARAVTLGGNTTAESMEILRDMYCGHLGTAFDLVDTSELVTDRWFRDAWCRSHNGGPIDIDIEKARPIQWAKIKGAATLYQQKREHSFEILRPLEIDWEATRVKIQEAIEPDELRAIWPTDLTETGEIRNA